MHWSGRLMSRTWPMSKQWSIISFVLVIKGQQGSPEVITGYLGVKCNFQENSCFSEVCLKFTINNKFVKIKTSEVKINSVFENHSFSRYWIWTFEFLSEGSSFFSHVMYLWGWDWSCGSDDMKLFGDYILCKKYG